jgi:dihydroflavonol-4-reductase
MYALDYCGDLARTVLRRDLKLNSRSVRLLHIMSPMDHRKAERELGWYPAPVHDAIRRAAVFYTEQRRDG